VPRKRKGKKKKEKTRGEKRKRKRGERRETGSLVHPLDPTLDGKGGKKKRKNEGNLSPSAVAAQRTKRRGGRGKEVMRERLSQFPPLISNVIKGGKKRRKKKWKSLLSSLFLPLFLVII